MISAHACMGYHIIKVKGRDHMSKTEMIPKKWTVFQTASFTKAKATKADACEEELSFLLRVQLQIEFMVRFFWDWV